MISNREPITITESAAAYLAGLLANDVGKAFRVSIDNRGCAGHKYRYDLVDTADISAMDACLHRDWGTVVIDVSSIMHILGSTLDLSEDQFNSQLVWSNPWAVSACGCGESFSLSKDACDHDHGSDPETVLR
jgi:iron-sulfur cluster assembly protein